MTVAMVSMPDDDRERRIDAAKAEYLAGLAAGRPIDVDAWLATHADISPQLAEFLDEIHKPSPLLSSFQLGTAGLSFLDRRAFPSTIADDEPTRGQSETRGESDGVTEKSPGDEPRGAMAEAPSRMILGRYRTIDRIAVGGFGEVYRSHDPVLNRKVAIKVPNPDRIKRPEEYRQFLREARTLALLKHENILPVYDLGTTSEGWCYIVSPYIDGKDLGQRMREAWPTRTESARVVEAVARAAHHAHLNGLVHRDIKPSNILIENSGRPLLADFGVALGDDEYGEASNWAGTPAYMSPEQARGEAHRVDGRSDVFSLGVVLYHLLVGELPFQGETNGAVMVAIATIEPKPPRQVNAAVPAELERISLRALAKRTSERYPTAEEMADDLRHFLADHEKSDQANGEHGPANGDPSDGSARPAQPRPAADVPSRLSPLVPKGLESFDGGDSDFFLDLLPGLRDREGVPRSVRFWIDRIDSTDPERSFRVGMIYGPSGCGKSSFVKAGLLPRLSERIESIYIEASESGTENRLRRALRRASPDAPGRASLVEMLTSLRRDQTYTTGRKHLIVIDQFEQWLLSYRGDEASELYSALRQCDGETLQALLLVRDDFWLGATSFMRQLDVELLSDRNMASIELFDKRHAIKVLTALGQGHGALPPAHLPLSRDQTKFLEEAVDELAGGEKVIPIELAVFAEMTRSKPWKSTTLKQVGGAHGLGATYLEEIFCSEHADPRLSRHQEAAQAILKSLLPSSLADVKGELRSASDLREVTGYSGRPREFDELIHILAVELRLISTAEPESAPIGDSAADWPKQAHYQLTHDYLVRSIREWADRKSRETWRGRAGRLLADRAALWSRRPERRQLPSLVEYVALSTATRRRDRTHPQAMYLQAAGRYHSIRTTAVIAALALGLGVAWDQFGRMQARSLRDQLLRSSPEELPSIIGEIDHVRRWAEPLLRASAEASRREGDEPPVGVEVALLDGDEGRASLLLKRLLSAPPVELKVVCDALKQHQQALGPEAWGRILDELRREISNISLTREGNLRAACALASLAPDDPRWPEAAPRVVECLTSRDPVLAGAWIEMLRPISKALTPILRDRFQDRDWLADRREIAASALAEYDGHDVTSLVQLAAISPPKSLSPLIVALQRHPDAAALLEAEFHSSPAPDDLSPSRVEAPFARRRAALAAAQLGVGVADLALEALKMAADPTMRSYLILQLSQARIATSSLLTQVRRADLDDSVLQGLILAIGQYDSEDLTAEDRRGLVAPLIELHRTHPDAGVHSAAGWLLSRLGARPEDLEVERADGPSRGRRWFVNRQGLAFSVVRGPIDFTFDKALVSLREEVPLVRVARSFAVSTTEVTRRVYREVMGEPGPPGWEGDVERPADRIDFYTAAKFCRLLSEREGISEDQMCYPPVGRIGPGMRLPDDHLSRIGYRLPTEAESMAASFGAARSVHPFGSDSGLLPHFARFDVNSEGHSGRVAARMPNHIGLFDMLGNVYEWAEPFPTGTVMASDARIDSMTPDLTWILRGGCFNSHAPLLMWIEYRNDNRPDIQDGVVGFRVVKTCR